MRVDQKEIQTLAKTCHIQTNNLCQFLPQDVVREFPEMKPQQVFHNTLKGFFALYKNFTLIFSL